MSTKQRKVTKEIPIAIGTPRTPTASLLFSHMQRVNAEQLAVRSVRGQPAARLRTGAVGIGRFAQQVLWAGVLIVALTRCPVRQTMSGAHSNRPILLVTFL